MGFDTGEALAALDHSFTGDINDGSRYRLLLVRGHLDLDLLGAVDTDRRAELLLPHWETAATIAATSPFADIDALVMLMETVLPIIGEHPRFRIVADRVDAIVAERGGKFAGAEQGRKRAIQYQEAGKLVLAVDQLQRAKEGWFSAETMGGSLLAMLNLAECYALLHLRRPANPGGPQQSGGVRRRDYLKRSGREERAQHAGK